MEKRTDVIIASALLALGLVICAIIFTSTWKGNYRSSQAISVTGSAKQAITSDLGFLRGTIQVESPTAQQAYEALQRQKPILVKYLQGQGFPDDKITFFTVNNYAVMEYTFEGRPTGRTLHHVYSQRVQVESPDVSKIQATSLEIASLISEGLNFNVEMPEYYYTKLAEIKVDIQAEAARDAMERAEKIAAATGRNLGTLTGARMGVLQITPPNSNMISDYGINDVSSIEKEITGVVNATFLID